MKPTETSLSKYTKFVEVRGSHQGPKKPFKLPEYSDIIVRK